MDKFIGIDISAATFDVVERRNGKNKKAKNHKQTVDSQNKFTEKMCKLNPKLIVMESTGVYHFDLAVSLYRAGLPIAVINPFSSKRFAELTLTNSKTDAMDSGLLAEYGERMSPRLWTAPKVELVHLKDLGRQINRLTSDKTRSKNRLHALTSKQNTCSLLIEDEKESIITYEARIKRLTLAAIKLIKEDDSLNLAFNNMQTAKGVGEASAISILAELCILPSEMKAKQVSRHAGLDIKLNRSGTSVKGVSRISKTGNAYLRSALFMVAMSASRFDENARAFKDCLINRGKKKLQAIIAIMRKYLTGIWASYQSGEAFDSRKLFSEIHKQNACV